MQKIIQHRRVSMSFRRYMFIPAVLVVVCILFVVWQRTISSVHNDYRLALSQWQSDLVSTFNGKSYSLDDWQCTKNDLIRRNKIFQDIKSKDTGWSSCYTSDYVEKLYLADIDDPDRQDKLFFDIGANKGYTIASWLSTWLPQLNITQKNVHHFLKDQFNINDCGACGDCNEPVLNVQRKNNTIPSRVTIHAFEPIRTTFETLLKTCNHFKLSDVFVHHLAISNSTGVMKMVKCPVGAESCGLAVKNNQPGADLVDVNTMTLDEFVEKNHIKRDIDLLKIDTEGADPLVLDGAQKLLAQERVRMLIFENHMVGMWQKINLVDVLRSLEEKGFICHLIGKTGMIRLTKCWLSIYDLKYWSNVLCVHRRQQRLRRFLNQLLI